MEGSRKIIFCVMDYKIIQEIFTFTLTTVKRARIFSTPHYSPVVFNNLYFVKSRPMCLTYSVSAFGVFFF